MTGVRELGLPQGNPLALPRATTGAEGVSPWRAVGSPVTTTESNYIGESRDNLAVDRSTGLVMLMENNAALTALSAKVYQISESGITTIASGSTTNANWVNTCNATNNANRRVVGAKGTFWLCSTGAYSATISGSTINFGTTALSIPSTTPKAGGGIIGAAVTYLPGTLAASDDGRLFCTATGAVSPAIEIDPVTRDAILGSTNTASFGSTYYGGSANLNRYVVISDVSSTTVAYAAVSFDLASHTQGNLTKTGATYSPLTGNGWALCVDHIDANTISINTAQSYANNGTISDTNNISCLYGANYFSDTASFTLLGNAKCGTKTSSYTFGDMFFEYATTSRAPGLSEKRWLVGPMPNQFSTTTNNTISFSVGQNLAVVITGTSMQAYAR